MDVSIIADLAGVGARYVLYLLVILSVLQLAVVIERAVVLYRTRARRHLGPPLAEAILKEEYSGLAEYLATGNSLAERALVAAAGRAADGPEASIEVGRARLSAERLELEKRLAFLGTLGNNAPFLGLFGTVLGIIHAIADLADGGAATSATSSTVLGGIAEALILTGAGLMVALPAVIGFNVFSRLIRLRAAEAERLLTELRAGMLGTHHRRGRLRAA